MPDYRKMYLTLFDAVERTLEVLDAPEQDTALAKDLLIAAQQTCEDIYVDTAEGRVPADRGSRGAALRPFPWQSGRWRSRARARG